MVRFRRPPSPNHVDADGACFSRRWLPHLRAGDLRLAASAPLLAVSGDSQRLQTAGSAFIWTGGAALSTNSSGSGYSFNGGVSSPGLPWTFGGGPSKTSLLSQKPLPLPKVPSLRAPADMTSAVPKED